MMMFSADDSLSGAWVRFESIIEDAMPFEVQSFKSRMPDGNHHTTKSIVQENWAGQEPDDDGAAGYGRRHCVARQAARLLPRAHLGHISTSHE